MKDKLLTDEEIIKEVLKWNDFSEKEILEVNPEDKDLLSSLNNIQSGRVLRLIKKALSLQRKEFEKIFGDLKKEGEYVEIDAEKRGIDKKTGKKYFKPIKLKFKKKPERFIENKK